MQLSQSSSPDDSLARNESELRMPFGQSRIKCCQFATTVLVTVSHDQLSGQVGPLPDGPQSSAETSLVHKFEIVNRQQTSERIDDLVASPTVESGQHAIQLDQD